MKKLLFTAASFVLALGMSQPAHAQTVTYDFTSCHVTGGCTGTDFGTVTLTQVGTNVLITLTLAAGEEFVTTGAGDRQYFKFNDGSAGTTTVSESSDFYQFNTSSPLLSFCGDGGGCFSYGIGAQTTGTNACTTGTCPYSGGITFTVNNTTIADLTQPNNLGQIFVADIRFTGSGLTGLVDVSPATVPDGGSTVMLLGSALLGIGALRRKFARS